MSRSPSTRGLILGLSLLALALLVRQLAARRDISAWEHLSCHDDAHASGTNSADLRAELAGLRTELTRTTPSPERVARLVHVGLDVDVQAAISGCRLILERDPGNEFALGHLAAAYLKAGQPQSALRYAAELAQRHPGAAAQNLTGTIYLNLHHPDEALAAFERAAALDPADAGAREGIARAKAAQAMSRHPTAR